MAARYLETERREFGLRAAEGIIDALYSVASWLREEGHIPLNAAQPAQYWRKRLKEEWAQRTGERRTRPNRPRHSEEEYRRIFAALSDPRVDPRIRRAIELAAECRTGQVLKPLSRDGARAAFQELERIARVPYVRGRGWCGLRRIAADMAETETTDDRVKDRLGGWKDSETRKQIYQDRATDRLRVEAASVRRRMRLGADLWRSTETSASPKPRAGIDLDAVFASLTKKQRAVLAARLNVPEMGSAASAAPRRV